MINIIIYVAHSYDLKEQSFDRAKKIIHDLQVNDLENTYICPLFILLHLGYNEIDYQSEMDLRKDLLSISDKLIVASDISNSVNEEIEFANLIGMEIEYLNA